MKNNKRIIITGATGQLGSLMVDFLLKNTNHEIIGAIRRTSQLIGKNLKNAFKNKRFKLIHLDLNDSHSITTTIKNEKPDFFINLGASTFVADSWSMPENHMNTNSIGVLHILEAIKNFKPKCKFYQASSSEMFGDVHYSPQDIKHPLSPRSPYGVSKCSAHLLCKTYRESYDMFVVSGVMFNNESYRRQSYFVTRKITLGTTRIKNAIDNNEKFEPIELGNIDAKRDWSDSEDFVEGIWLMMNQDKPKDYILSSNETHSVREFVEEAFKVVGIEGRWEGSGVGEVLIDIKNPLNVLIRINPKFYRPAEVNLLLGDSTPARQELGWSPSVSFKQLVTKMVLHDLEPYKKA